jgi:hypothetical protein
MVGLCVEGSPLRVSLKWLMEPFHMDELVAVVTGVDDKLVLLVVAVSDEVDVGASLSLGFHEWLLP